MAIRKILFKGLFASAVCCIVGCISKPARFPQNVAQVYQNVDVQQALLMAAQNNILFYVPEATVRDVEKTEIDPKCRKTEDPFWASKLLSYLNEFKKHPEFLTRFHVIELKRGDVPQVTIQKDLIDGAITLSIEYVKIESHGKVTYQTNMPCSGSLAEQVGRDIIKTDFEFPTVKSMADLLQKSDERPQVARFQFSNKFLSYLAERGAIFKFTHELSFEKSNNKKFVMAEILNKLGKESDQPFHKYINFWFKEISQKSTQAELIQMFAALPDKEPKAGVRVESEGEQARRVLGQSDLTYMYTSYMTDEDQVKIVSLNDLDKCLQTFTNDMSGIKFRKPAATEKESFLRPGYTCIQK